MLLQDLFRGGRLVMSADPLSTPDEFVWTDVLTNRILAVAAILLMLVNLPGLFRLVPHLSYSFDRVRGAADLEHSLGLARLRNRTALIYALPYCLIADHYVLARPRLLDGLPAAWTAPATLGLLAAYLLLRAGCHAVFRPRRLSAEARATLRHIPYNFFIALSILALSTVGILTAARAPESLFRTVLLWETAAVAAFSFCRSGQFLASFGMGFTTFLYLCALEIIPAALLVAAVMLF